ncbi:hypothetical protein QP561_11740, partial [Veillonella nakazawae]|nr:hypothetical protein [Veillonella nakazawae]
EFNDQDQILVILKDGTFYLSTFEATSHYEDNILRIEKFDAEKVWTAVVYDADNQGYAYLKRFQFEAIKRRQSYIGDNT